MAVRNAVRREVGPRHRPFAGAKARQKKLIQNVRGLDPVEKEDHANLWGLDLVEN